MKKIMFLVVASLLAFSGCGEGEDGPSPFIGSWDSPCAIDPEGGSTKSHVLILDGSLSFDVWSFDTTNCAEPVVMNINGEGTYTENGTVSATLGGNSVKATRTDTTFTKYNMLISFSLVDTFNLIQFCGKSDWTSGVQIDVLSCFVPENPEKGLYYVDKSGGTDVIYFEAENSSKDADGYPTTLDPEGMTRN